MAHRGLYQTYHRRDLTHKTCTAERIYEPTHSLLENTIPSLKAAFDLNADIVELDVHSTTDEKIVVFHDWTLECRTNGFGVTEEQTFEYLRSLDIGHGYTADNHKTYPFRCNPIRNDYQTCMKRNQMPTLREVLVAFPDKRFVINMKSKNPLTLATLINELKNIEKSLKYDLSKLSFYCNHQPIHDAMKAALPMIDVPKLLKHEASECMINYFKTGFFAEQCAGAWLGIQYDDFFQLGDKAEKLLKDVHSINSSSWILGVDSAESYKYIKQYPIDAFWTDRIDLVGPVSFPKK
jgi:glycerophosphoryl diester phosphodiesterase